MDNYAKTTTIPDGDLKDVIGKPILKMVVLGNHPKLLQYASEIADDVPEDDVDRKILWFKNPSENKIKGIFPDFKGDFDKILAFSVSTTDTIADYIKVGDKIGYIRTSQSFMRAGKPEFN